MVGSTDLSCDFFLMGGYFFMQVKLILFYFFFSNFEMNLGICPFRKIDIGVSEKKNGQVCELVSSTVL